MSRKNLSLTGDVTVLGAGSWGTALASLLTENARTIHLWGRDNALIATLREHRENRRYLPGITLKDNIHPTTELREAVAGSAFVVWAVPSGAVRSVALETAPFLPEEAILLSAAKGLEDSTGLRMSQVLADVLPNAANRIVALSGPNLAVEMAKGLPTASVVASTGPDAAKAAQELFTTPTLRIYTGSDVIGVELGGAVKNVIAIGAGVSDGLGFGDNSKAALMTRGLTEAVRLGHAQGAETATFMGLSGIGDLMATGASRLSRNYRVGFALGQGRTLAAILEELGQVAEGVPTTHALCELARRIGVEMPLCEALYQVLFDGRPAPEVIRELMLRPPKQE